MPHDHSPTAIPLERYRDIMAVLTNEQDSLHDRFWMRHAAQVASLCPGEPGMLALRIRTIAASLKRHAPWYETLSSPVRFVVAAQLLQHGIVEDEFLVEHNRIGGLLHHAGLPRGGFHETMAILILRLSTGSRPVSVAEVQRVRALYDRMKHLHWWLTGTDDLPACAALSHCEGTPEVVVACTENAYWQLQGAGLKRGNHLQTAACILPLAGIGTDMAVQRFLRLKIKLEDQLGGEVRPARYDALAVLSLLDHWPERVIENVMAVRKELNLFQPEQEDDGNFQLAVDLSFLDLVRFDRDLATLTTEQRRKAMQSSLRAFHFASMVMVSQLSSPPLAPEAPVEFSWPSEIL